MIALQERDMPEGMSDIGSVQLLPPEPDCFRISASADVDNNAIVLWGRSAHSDRMLITRQRENEIIAVVDTAARNYFGRTHIQSLPDGKTLLVASRMFTSEDRNAVVVGDRGDVVIEGALGDGIDHLLTTTAGDIWAGYFDEGIHSQSSDLGGGGIVRFNESLARTWDYNAGDAGGRAEHDHPVYDCYSLNVTDTAVFACTYTGFPIIHINSNGSSQTNSGLKGVKHMLVNHDRIALLGSYAEGGDHLAIGSLQQGRYVEHLSTNWAVIAEPHPYSKQTIVTRGPQLNVFHHQFWSRYQLD